jgi:hypothetical protein
VSKLHEFFLTTDGYLLKRISLVEEPFWTDGDLESVVTDAGRLEMNIRLLTRRSGKENTEWLIKACRSEKFADVIGHAFLFAECEVGSN